MITVIKCEHRTHKISSSSFTFNTMIGLELNIYFMLHMLVNLHVQFQSKLSNVCIWSNLANCPLTCKNVCLLLFRRNIGELDFIFQYQVTNEMVFCFDGFHLRMEDCIVCQLQLTLIIAHNVSFCVSWGSTINLYSYKFSLSMIELLAQVGEILVRFAIVLITCAHRGFSVLEPTIILLAF